MKLSRFTKDISSTTPTGKPSLSRILFVIPMIIATIASLSLAFYFSFREIHRYREDQEKIKKDFPLNQRHELQFRILNAKDFIHFVRTHSDPYISSYINSKLNETASILAENIDSSDREIPGISPSIAQKIDALFLNSAIQVAVINPQGRPLYTSNADSSLRPEETSVWSSIKKALSQGYNYALPYAWEAIPASETHKQVVLSGKTVSGNLTLLALVTPSDSIRLMQELVLDSLVKIRYENGEYIFINTFDGQGLITKGVLHRIPLDILSSKDTNWKNIFDKEIVFAQKPSGDFLTYKWQKDNQTGYSEKVSYISGIEDWKWIIGTGMHTFEIEPILQLRKDELRSSMRKEFIMFVAFLILLFLIIFFISRFVSNLTSSNIRLFVRFLKNAAISMQPLDESKIHFREFQTLAKAANQMISERDRIKADLATEQSRLKYIIDSIPDLIFFKDTNSLFVGCNRAFEKFIGMKSFDIVGSSEYDLFTKSTADLYIESDKKLLATYEPFRNTEWVTYPDGRKVLCDTLKTLYFDAEGNVLGIIGISRDITEMEETRQRLIMAKEKAEESDRLKTAFLANMSHEIRTPMNAIIGFSDLLSDEDLSIDEREDFISKIKLSGESLMNIINDIIDIAKIEAGQLKISDSECNVDQLLNDLLGTFLEIKNKTNKTDLVMKLSIPVQESPFWIIADPLRLQQVLTNLLSNALKFTEFGEIDFGYTFNDDKIEFFVKDTGIGILRGKQQLLFQRFSQVDTSTTRKYGGTGLGLAISRNIIELMGGTIWLESEPGQGSIFRFTLPYRRIDYSTLPVPEDTRTNNWKGKTILIAEDIDQNFVLMEAVLRFTQVTLLHAPDGQVAIDMVKETPGINLVLMDIQLPVKSGYEAIHEIRQMRPELPIVSFTAYALPREREKSLEAGCVDFMNKPIKADMLLSVIRRYI